MRIHTTGNAGSGKTTLASHVGQALNIPVYGLDEIVWQPGWMKTPTEQRQRLEHALVSRPEWVIEGVSATARKVAEIVILLDVTRPVAYFRCARRNWRYLLRSRPGLPPDCPEIQILPRLCRIIWRFPRTVQPQIIADVQSATGRLRHVSSPSELSAALAEIGISSVPRLSL